MNSIPDLNVIVGAEPALFTSRTCGNVAWLDEEVDCAVGGWIVTFRQAKILLCNRERKIAGTLGKPVVLN